VSDPSRAPDEAKLGREGRAGAAADDDRGHQRPELPADGDADQIGDEDVGAIPLELCCRLERHRQADQEVDRGWLERRVWPSVTVRERSRTLRAVHVLDLVSSPS
jgi:hypothetical protein